MNMAHNDWHLRYNERAWAIDVISEINTYCNEQSRAIVRAGGEYGLHGSGNSLYPDILLFGNASGTMVLQGWELKMPDTDINDPQFIENATEKALRLNLSSFLLWNVREAALYQKSNNNKFTLSKSWIEAQILRRDEVQANRSLFSL